MEKKLRRSKSNRMIAGVCGGIGEFLNIDASIIRIIWLVFIFMSDTPAVLAYILCLLVIPEDDGIIYADNNDDIDDRYDKEKKSSNSNLFIGISLILIGAYFLIQKIWPNFINQFYNIRKYWPILLVILGIYILFKKEDDYN